jgi:hypothetical protein
MQANDYLLTYSGWNILAMQSQMLAQIKGGRARAAANAG